MTVEWTAEAASAAAIEAVHSPARRAAVRSPAPAAASRVPRR